MPLVSRQNASCFQNLVNINKKIMQDVAKRCTTWTIYQYELEFMIQMGIGGHPPIPLAYNSFPF